MTKKLSSGIALDGFDCTTKTRDGAVFESETGEPLPPLTVLFRDVRSKVPFPLASAQAFNGPAGIAVGAEVKVKEKLPEAVPGHPDASEMPVKTKEPVPENIVGILMVNVPKSMVGKGPDPE